MPEKPWYHDGLRFECTDCGNCGTGAPGYVWVNKAEIEAIARLVHVDLGTFEKKYLRRVGIRYSLVEFRNGDCVFFDPEKRTCGIYEVRPRQCRTWPFWPSNVRTPKAWQEMARDCPGADHGRLYSAAEIETRLDVLHGL